MNGYLDRHDLDESVLIWSAGVRELADEIKVLASDLNEPFAEVVSRKPSQDELRAASEIFAAWTALQKAFADATRVGPDSFLVLGIGYADEDEEDEVVYIVAGAYQFSPAGRKFQDRLGLSC